LSRRLEMRRARAPRLFLSAVMDGHDRLMANAAF